MATKVKTLRDWQSAHDQNVQVPAKITAALIAMLKEGAEQWEYESDFTKRARINNSQLGQFRDQFAGHIVVSKDGSKSAKNVWFADKKVAKKARGE